MKYFLCLCSWLMCLTAVAQDLLLVRVLNEDSAAIAGATVNVFCNGKTTPYIANKKGEAQIKIINNKCRAAVNAIGYETIYNITLSKENNIVVLEKKNVLLNEIIVTGQTKATHSNTAVQKVSAINSQQIKQLAVNNVTELLNTQSSFFIQNDNILGSAANILGIGGQNIKVLINGVPINGRENGNIDLSQINIANVDRVEIIKGPMSVLYGTDALGGVINIITKAPALKTRVELQSFYETTNKLNNNICLGIAKKRHSLNLNAGRNFFGGYTYLDSFNRAQLWKPKEQYTADANYTFQFSKGKISYSPIYMQEHIVNKGIPVVTPFSAGAVDENYYNKRWQQILATEFEIDSKRKLIFTNSIASYNRIRQRLYKDMITLREQNTLLPGDQDTSKFLDYNLRGLFSNSSNELVHFTVGYDFNLCYANSLKINGRTKQMEDYAFFVSTPVYITPKITLQPAIRISYNNRYNTQPMPSFNIKYAANEKLTIRSAYARGFRAPSLKEMYLSFVDLNHNVTGNDSLVPEQGHHVQLNTDYILLKNNKKKWVLNTNTYFNAIDNQIGLALTSATRNEYKYKNILQFKNLAQEVSTTYINNKFTINGGITLNHILGVDTFNGFTNFELTAKCSYKLAYYTSINANYRFINKQAILGISTIADQAYYNSYIPSMHLGDVNFTHGFFKDKLQVQLGARNVFNITQLQTQGASLNTVHSNNGPQNISPGASGLLSVRWSN